MEYKNTGYPGGDGITGGFFYNNNYGYSSDANLLFNNYETMQLTFTSVITWPVLNINNNENNNEDEDDL